jgi:hypothetical protein
VSLLNTIGIRKIRSYSAPYSGASCTKWTALNTLVSPSARRVEHTIRANVDSVSSGNALGLRRVSMIQSSRPERAWAPARRRRECRWHRIPRSHRQYGCRHQSRSVAGQQAHRIYRRGFGVAWPDRHRRCRRNELSRDHAFRSEQRSASVVELVAGQQAPSDPSRVLQSSKDGRKHRAPVADRRRDRSGDQAHDARRYVTG